MEAIADVVEVGITDEDIAEEFGILAGRDAARRFAERLGEIYEEVNEEA